MFDDRKMEASAADIAAEERRSARMGRAEDEREAEEEARRSMAKAEKKDKRQRKRGTAALFDD
jgi:F0F1-type ATP synthase membrane subunit b/b'